jgi:hypothetical protein
VSGFGISMSATSPTNNAACINGVPSSGLIVNANINNNNLINGNFGVNLGNNVGNFATGTLVIENNTASGQVTVVSTGSAYQFQGVENATITFTNNEARNVLGNAVNVQAFGGVIMNMINNVIEGGIGTGLRIVAQGSGSNGNPEKYTIAGNVINNNQRLVAVNAANNLALTTVIVEENELLNGTITSFVGNNSNGGALCVRFNNNTGYPYAGTLPTYSIGVGTTSGLISLESPMNNFPQPVQGSVTTVDPCSCGQPCN